MVTFAPQKAEKRGKHFVRVWHLRINFFVSNKIKMKGEDVGMYQEMYEERENVIAQLHSGHGIKNLHIIK